MLADLEQHLVDALVGRRHSPAIRRRHLMPALPQQPPQRLPAQRSALRGWRICPMLRGAAAAIHSAPQMLQPQTSDAPS